MKVTSFDIYFEDGDGSIVQWDRWVYLPLTQDHSLTELRRIWREFNLKLKVRQSQSPATGSKDLIIFLWIFEWATLLSRLQMKGQVSVYRPGYDLMQDSCKTSLHQGYRYITSFWVPAWTGQFQGTKLL